MVGPGWRERFGSKTSGGRGFGLVKRARLNVKVGLLQ